MPYLLALNCGSSSLKSQLYRYTEGDSTSLKPVAKASASNVGAKGRKVELKVSWTDSKGEDKKVEKEQADVEYSDLPGLILEMLSKTGSSFDQEEIKVISHRIVHGADRKDPIVVTSEHREGLEDMDKLSSFAPLHNHSAVLAVRSCLDALPSHTSVLLFDTLFHQTLPKPIYTYAVPKIDHSTPVPIRKYGFHGLSYASVLRSLAKKLEKEERDVSCVVCHLGSGGSVCMIEKGQSADTSMGLTPLEGLVGGTRSGSIDPTLIFHHTPDAAEDVGKDGMHISKAETVLNKSSGLVALAGTSDFGTIISRMEDPSSCSSEEHDSASLAYEVYLDRLLHFLSFYLFKLKSNPSVSLDAIVFSGGIGERAPRLRTDVGRKLAWLGVEIDEELNAKVGKGEETVELISRGSKDLSVFVVQTDEEEQCARMALTHLHQ